MLSSTSGHHEWSPSLPRTSQSTIIYATVYIHYAEYVYCTYIVNGSECFVHSCRRLEMNKEDDRIGICCSDEVVIVVKPDRPSLSMDEVIKQVQSPSTTFECKSSKQAAVGRGGGGDCKYISGVIWRLKSKRSWVGRHVGSRHGRHAGQPGQLEPDDHI